MPEKTSGSVAPRQHRPLVLAPCLRTLLHSGQFVLGPSTVERLAGWKRLAAGPLLQITAHPGLSLCRRTEGDRALTLIGFVLDPLRPQATDAEILSGLLDEFGSVATLIRATQRLGGRWLLVAQQAERRFLFNDPLGLRQAFYTDPQQRDGALWVMSQPGLMAESLGLTVDPLALDYRDWRLAKGHAEYMWPGSRGPFREIRHLLPNHYLDLDTGRCHRFWPHSRLHPVSVDDAIDRLAERVPQLLRAAANRGDLVLGLTAGIDSRLLLAAAKSIREQISCVSVRQAWMPADHADLAIPARLSRRLGVRHDLIAVAKSMSGDFREIYARSVFLAHEHYGADVEALVRHYGCAKAVATGSGSEVGRGARFRIPPFDGRPSPEFLAMREMGGLHPFTIESLREWHAGVPGDCGIGLLDLFEWELGHGNWLAMTQLEFDIAWREIFTPFNCRDVLSTLLAAPRRCLRPPACSIYHAVIERLWPQTLDEPINPHKNQGRLRHRVTAMRFLAKYGLARAAYALRTTGHTGRGP